MHFGENSLFHLEAADKGMDAISLIWPGSCPPQKQPFGREFFPEASLLLGAECPAKGAALAFPGETLSPGWRVGILEFQLQLGS